jgi:hypothetical protein
MFGSPLPPVVCRRVHVLLCIVCMFTYIDVQHSAVAHLFSFLCFVFCFVCLRPVSYVLTVADFSGLSFLDFHFGFL